MKQSQLWEFLGEQERRAVESQVERIRNKQKLPQPIRKLYQQIHIPSVKGQQIDPIKQVIQLKVAQINKEAVLKVYELLTDKLLLMISKSVSRLEEERTIAYLGAQYSRVVNQTCNRDDFEWRVWAYPNGSLWERLNEEVKKVLTGTLRFMMKVYEIAEIDVAKEAERGIFKMEHRLSSEKKRLDSIFFMESSVVKSLIKMEKEVDNKSELKNGTAVEGLFDQIQKIEKEKQCQQDKNAKKGKSQDKPETVQKQEDSFMQRLSNKGKELVGKFTAYFQSNGQEQKDLKDFEGADLETRLELKEEEKEFVIKLSYKGQLELIQLLQGQFSQQDKWDLEYLLRLPLMRWEENENLVTGPGKLVQANRLELYRLKNTLYNNINNLREGKRKEPGIFLVLTGLFYKTLEKEYSTLVKRYLVRVLEGIENLHDHDCPYLRGALKIYEMKDVEPSLYAAKLVAELPYRSPSFQSSERSKVFKENLERQSELKPDPPSKDLNKNLLQNEVIAIQRLTYSKPCKNVTFLVSGYLSENTDKDQEWKGIIKALGDTECYGLLWKSSTIKQLLNYLAIIGGGLALKKVGSAYPLIAMAGIGAKIVNGIMNKESKQENPFWLALERADEAGKEFAQLLMKHFSDRHITLIGYSMGTEVIKACVERLERNKMEGMLLNVVTLGGVAVREDVEKIMRHCHSPLSWINYQSRRDYSVRYMFRVCTLGSRPIGWGGVRKVSGHEVENVDVSQLVAAHLLFRRNLYGLTLLTGLNHY